MTDPSLRRLALADLDPDTLERLILHGEDLFVERKLKPPEPPKFGAEVASFANTMGGWLLLGVKDDRTVDEGYEKPEQLDLQSHLAAVLRKEVDPLPPFVAEMFEYRGKPVGVMRIFESADPPHIVRGTGAVYLRDSEGKKPVDDHSTLLAIAQRGRDAESEARKRIGSLPEVSRILMTPDSIPDDVIAFDESELRYVVRSAPVTMNPAAADWVLTRRAGNALVRIVDELLPRPALQQGQPPASREEPMLSPYGRATQATVRLSPIVGRGDSAMVVADSGGVFAAEYRRAPHWMQKKEAPDAPVEHWISLDGALNSEMRPLARAVATMLAEAEAIGRALRLLGANASAHLRVQRSARGAAPPLLVRRAHDPG